MYIDNEAYLLQGFKEGFNPLPIEQMPTRIIYLLNKIPLEYQIEEKEYSNKTLHIKTEAFFANHFEISPIIAVNIPYLSSFRRTIKNTYDPSKIKELLNRCTSHISPFELPLYFTKDSKVNSCLFNSYMNKYHLPFTALPENKNLVNCYISICQDMSIITPFEYTHEITHTQVMHHFGTIKNVHNEEFLSIFLEKLHAYETGREEYLTIEKFRLNDLKNKLSNYKLLCNNNVCTFIISTINAEILFYLYIKSNNQTKQEILNDINKILNGHLTIDKFLKKYELYPNHPVVEEAIEYNLSL